MATGNNPSLARISLEVDNESALPKLLEGRTVAIIGRPLENYTAESREPDRRRQLHDQLRRARALRASLEEAADLAETLPNSSPSSYPTAMSILHSSLPDMNRLVRLTEAIRGKHVMVDDPETRYDEWNEWTRRKDEEEGARRGRERRVLRRQLREFAREKNPGAKVDEALESRHDSFIPKPKGESEAGEAQAYGKAGASTTKGPPIWGAVYDDVEGTLSPSGPDSDDDKIAKEFTIKPSNFDTGSENDNNNFARFKQGGINRRNYNPPTPAKEAYTAPIHQSPDAREADLPMQSPVTNNSTPNNNPKVGSRSDKASKRNANLTSHVLLLKPPAKKAKVSVTMDTKENDSVISAKASPTEKPPARKDPPEMKKAPPEMKKAPPETKKPAVAKPITSAPSRKNRKEAPCAPVAISSQRSARPHADGRKNKARVPKRCHDCKLTTTRYRNCNYWKLTGKCRKMYCIDCLLSKYSVGNAPGVSVEEIVACPAYDAEWHCPSCLGACECKACAGVRKKEEERERTRTEAGRNSRSRRSATSGNSYSYFF